MKSNKPQLEGSIVFKKFCLTKKLGTGAFGEIYLATNNENNDEQYAVKAEPVTTRHPQLVFESKLYKWLNSNGEAVGIPKVHAVSLEIGYNLMMMDLLGISLEDLFVSKNKTFSVKTVLMIALQMIDRLEFMHSRQFLHRDIKPDNILMGVGNKSHIVYLVDMGLAKKYIKDGKHIPYKEGKELTGTARYASIGTHKGIEQARRDDIQSLGYVLMYFLRGILPWQNMKAKDTRQKYNMIMNKKISTPVEVLCEKYPQQLAIWITYARKLKFQQQPDYQYLRSLIQKAMARLDIQFDYLYDWTNK